MKKLFYTLLVAATGLLAAACVQEHIEAVYDPAAATVQTLGEFGDFTLSADGDAITTTFNPADFKLPVATTYTLFASAASDMSDMVKVSATISVDENGIGHISVKQAAVNSLVFALGGVADEPFPVYFQLLGSMANDKNGAIEPTMMYSNIVSATFTAYSTVIKDVDLYDHIWVIGASASVGGWSFDNVYQFLYDYEKSGHTYTGLIDFGEAGPSGGFKLVGVGNWNDENLNWGSEAQAEEPEQATIQLIASGGSKDIKCYSKRFYFFSYDTNTLVLTAKYGLDNVGIVGDFNGWNPADADLKMAYNDKFHRFYIDYTFAESTGLKFTCDDDWALNWGGNDGTIAGGGDNIAVEPGSYRIYLDINKGTYEFSTSMYGKDEPTGDDTPVEPVTYEGWGVVGTINGWGAPDVHMTTMGDFWVAKNVALTPDDQFKFRKDEDWAENIGATGDVEPFVVTIGAKCEGAAGGKNLSVPEAGTYDLYVNPGSMAFYVMAAGEVPGEIATWGVVGTITSWSDNGNIPDLAMTETDGLWVRTGVELSASDQIKVRFQNNWDVNRGGPGSVEPFVMDGSPVAAVPGGKNLGVAEDGTYDVYYDALNEILFVVKTGEAIHYWGVVGTVNNWGNAGDGYRRDFIMAQDGDFVVYKGLALTTEDQFKIRQDSDWSVNKGASGSTEPYKVDPNVSIEAADGGKNLGVNQEGRYDIYYNATEGKIYVMAEGEQPEGAVTPIPTQPDHWGLCGDMTSWSDGGDIPMEKKGDWFVSIGVVLEAGNQFKLRGDGAWTINRGYDIEDDKYVVTVGEGFPVIQNGKNLQVTEAGTYDVYYDSANEKVYVMASGATPEGYKAYPDYIYAIGGDTGWSNVYPLAGNGEGVFTGFGYLSQPFKFKPNENNWEGDWEYDGEGKIADNGGDNCPAPDASYYKITVDLVQMTYSLVAIESISIIGTVNGDWNNDTDLTYNPESGAWEVSDVALNAGIMKFRSNHAWDGNPDWGGSLDALTQGGGNIAIEAGTYDIKLFAWCDGKAYATMTKK